MRKKGDMMCSCGKRKGTCNCKGYAYGSEKIKGYYMGDAAVATPQQEQEMMAMQPGVRLQAPIAQPQGPSAEQQIASMAGQTAISKGVDVAKEKAMETGPMQSMFGGSGVAGLGKVSEEAAMEGVKNLSMEAQSTALKEGGVEGLKKAGTKAAAGSAGMQALGGAGTAVIGDLLTKGEVDSGTLKKAALGAVGNMLLPGVGGVVGSMLGGMFKDGTPAVPPMGYADGTAKMTPEEYQMKFIKERILEPAEAYVEERPMLQAPLLMAAAARDYERGQLPLGKFGGGKLEGGKDRIAYRHKKYGDFEFNPESERVSYKKTFRF